MASAIIGIVLGASGGLGQGALGQDSVPMSTDQGAPQFSAEQLDQMLAPIALYPDPLLAQILMAATYPLEVVEADRWVHGLSNSELKSDRLTAALEEQPWDPSVKSLVRFHQILRMMDLNLEWTERLGDAFLADQAGVMDSIQRLRQRAKAAGKLGSTQLERITAEGPAIEIEPPSPERVYVPIYDPSDVYGTWPYPEYPPSYFPGVLNNPAFYEPGFAFVGVVAGAPLCGWNHWDWVHRRIDIDRDRFAILNRNRQPIGGVAWEHDPSHRGGVPYRDWGVRERFAGRNGIPEVRRSFRGPMVAVPEFRSAAPAVGKPRVLPQAPEPLSASRLPMRFGFDRGPGMPVEIQHGHASRIPMPTFAPRRVAPRFAHGPAGLNSGRR
jgi:hypothetical protein